MPRPSSLKRLRARSIGAAAENVAEDVGAMQPRRISRRRRSSRDEGEMHHRIERRPIGVPAKSPIGVLIGVSGDALDQLLARLPIGDQVRHGNAFQFVLVREIGDLRPDHHRAVVVGQFADHSDRPQSGELAEVDRRLGMAGAHQHPSLLRDQRKHVAGTHEIGRAHVAVGERAGRVAALLGGNARGQPCLTSTDTVKAVPSGASLTATIGADATAWPRPRSAARRRCRSRCG